MAASKEDVTRWLEQAKKEGATHVVIVCDLFDYEDYPVEVKPGQDVQEIVRQYRTRIMTRVQEVYSLSRDLEEQLNELIAWHLD